jgi:phosphatidylinositol alpha-mannosyltransferase
VKIAVVSPYDFASPGGVQDQVAKLVAWLGEAGHRAWAVAPGTGGPEGTRHVGRTLTVPANRSRAPIGYGPLIGPGFREAVEDAEVVHVHEPFMPRLGTAAVRLSPVPVVGTFHADPSAFVRRLYRLGGGVFRRLAGRLAVATAVSETARDALVRLVDARIVPNGIDVAAARDPQAVRVGGRVVFIGRDEPRKGLDVLLQAWPLVRTDAPDATLRVIGCRRLSGPAGVEFLGRVPDDAKRRDLSGAEVLCAPNLGGESFGVILVEGMAAGCAVVASDLPAFRAVAAGAAVFTPAGDVDDLGRALGGLLADRDEVRRRAEAGAERVMRFDRSAVVEGYLAAYRDALRSAATAT